MPLLTSMLCSSVVKAFFYSKTWYRDKRRLVMSEYVENSISKNRSRSNVRILTLSTTYVVLYTDITYTQNIHVYWYMHGGCEVWCEGSYEGGPH